MGTTTQTTLINNYSARNNTASGKEESRQATYRSTDKSPQGICGEVCREALIASFFVINDNRDNLRSHQLPRSLTENK